MDEELLQVSPSLAELDAKADCCLVQVFLLPRSPAFNCCSSDDERGAPIVDDCGGGGGVVAFCPFSKVSAEGSSPPTALAAWKRAAILRFGGDVEPHLHTVDDASKLARRKVWSLAPAAASSGQSAERFLIDFAFLSTAVLFDPALGTASNVADWRKDVSAAMFDVKVQCTPFFQLPQHFFSQPPKISMTPHFCN